MLAVRDIPLYAEYLECLAKGNLKEVCLRNDDMRRLSDWVDSKRTLLPNNLAPTATQMFIELPNEPDGTPRGNMLAKLKGMLLAGKKLHVRGSGPDDHIIKLGRGKKQTMTVEKRSKTGGFVIPT